MSLAQIRSLVLGESEPDVKDVSFLFPITPYQSLQFKKRQGYKKKLLTTNIHRGFDTETNFKGDTVLLCDDKGRKVWNPSLLEVLGYLTYKEYRKSINWFYNITFDIESVLKMLPESNLMEIIEDNKTEYEGFKLFYLPHKYFKVSDKSKHSIGFYDIAQFYGMSLDNASKEYLNDTKSIADIKSVMEYMDYDRVKNVVYAYCKHDCDLTKRLAERMYKGVLDCNITFSKPFSRASLAETAFLEHCDLPEYLDAPLGVNKMHYWSYYGGWFELMKRGYHNHHLIEYDINSAYPYAMLNLPDLRDVVWERVRTVSGKSVMGVYQIAITPKRSVTISPLQLRTESLSVHPHASSVRYATDIELEMLKDEYNIKVISGFEAYGDKIRYPFRDYVNKLYEDKSNYKYKDEMMYECVKRVLNGFYGKTIQRTGGKIGNCFNPVYAARITASCRKQVWDAVKDHQDDVIAIHTDSCIMTKEIDLDEGVGLGQWERKDFKEGIFLLSGVYEMLGDEKKTKIRGYESKMRLLETLKKYPDKNTIEIRNEKPLHLKQAISQRKHDVSETNTFLEEIKTISCKYDQKRVWEDGCESWGEFCNDYWGSIPITKYYTPISESEYLAKQYKILKESQKYYHDGEARVLIRGV